LALLLPKIENESELNDTLVAEIQMVLDEQEKVKVEMDALLDRPQCQRPEGEEHA
jgi:hypothetical protein